MKQYIEKLLYIGVQENMPLAEKIRIQNLNKICGIAGTLAAINIPLVIDSQAASIGVCMYAITLYSVYIFHYFQQSALYNLFATFILSLLNIMFASCFDKRLGVEMFFILSFVGNLLHVGKYRFRLVNATWLAICLFVPVYLQYYNLHFFKAPRLATVIFFLNIIISTILLGYSVIRFRNTLIDSQLEVQHKNDLLEEKTEELQKSNEVKDKLFSIIGHDLRAPLTSISGFLSLLEMDILTTEQKQLYIQKLKNAISGSSETLDNLAFWYIQHQQNFDAKKENLSLFQNVQTVVNTLNILAEQKHITLTYHIPENILVETNANFLPFILRNLISNAIKFTPNGGEITIFITQHTNTELWIAVQDTGIGIKSENIDKLFQAGGSFTTLGTNKEKGTGLGLPFCKEFAEKNGSRLWVESKEGQGSTFYFSLPYLYK